MAFKRTTDRAIVAAVESVWGTAADAGGGEKWRHSSISLDPEHDRFADDEQRDDHQKLRSGRGMERVTGTIEFGMSAGSHQSLYEAVAENPAAEIASITGVQLDVAASGSLYTIHRDTGDFIADDVRAWTIMRLTAGVNAGSRDRDLLIVALTTSTATVFVLDGGSLTEESNVSSCTIAFPGARIIVPSSGHLDRSFTMEDVLSPTLTRLFTGVKAGNFSADLSPGANAKGTCTLLGKAMTKQTTPYFTSPAALGTTKRLASPRGVVVIENAIAPALTQLNFTLNGAISADAVIGSNSAAAIGRDPLTGSGNLVTYLDDATFIDRYTNDTAFGVAAYLRDVDGNFRLFVLPECVATPGVKVDTSGRFIRLQIPFEFSKKPTTTGHDETTFIMQDSLFAEA